VFRGHSGGIEGGLTDMAYLPAGGRGYTVMINSENGAALSRITTLVRHYVIRDLTPPALPAAGSIPAELQQRYAGYYEAINPRIQQLYAFQRLGNVTKLSFSGTGLSTSTYGIHREQWVPMSDRLFRRSNQSIATIALLPDADGETLIQFGWGTFKKVSAVRAWGQCGAAALTLVLILSSFLFALIWIPRKLLGKLRNAGPLSVRTLPMLSSILLVLYFGLFWEALQDPGEAGVPCLLTISILVLSVAFPLTTAASLYFIFRERSAPMNRAVYWHSILVAVAMAVATGYLGYWGLLGLRLWA
jgi:hypothetical protein